MNIPTPGLFPTGNYRKDGYALMKKLVRTKSIEVGDIPASGVDRKDSYQENKLKKCLTTLDLTSLGVGSCVGTGMYLVSGMVARIYAGPGVIFSFAIAALASILSGACYAEFGVRVPHTTGSAYMYSYVTVGEFVAFIIGWNMILEYLIGTAACACALSACFDSLTNGKFDETMAEIFGKYFGHTPDMMAVTFTLGMMLVIAVGVKKSLMFNNAMNAINFSVWVFIMTAGLFYINFENWSKNGGFLPKGLSGVFSGAATCFYAFIGFDIIATTGEEATNPKKSIPTAIISSLIIVLIAYITSSMMLTLIIPYNDIAKDSALVDMFGQVGAYKCQYVVVIGALAGLTVSMFGSMFPMPRIIYAMAQDGLIFRSLGTVLPLTGTPVLATVISGSAAAFAAFVLDLEILVEMMSIGTLLAYTLVSTCVLILRYQPYATNLVGLLPEVLRTPVKGSPVKECIPISSIKDRIQDPVKSSYGVQRQASTSIPMPFVEPPKPASNQSRKIIVRRVTRGSPDSDDTFGEEDSEECSTRDDQNQQLFMANNGDKYYGTTPAAMSSSENGFRQKLSYYLQVMAQICPVLFPWVNNDQATEESGKTVMKYIAYLYIVIITLNVILVFCTDPLNGFTKYIVYALLIGIIILTAAISKKPQNKETLVFMTPGVPFIPVTAVLVNIYLILNLSGWTLVRFTIWMIIGFVVYFYYGIKNSSLEIEAEFNSSPDTLTPQTPYGPPKQILTTKKPNRDKKPPMMRDTSRMASQHQSIGTKSKISSNKPKNSASSSKIILKSTKKDNIPKKEIMASKRETPPQPTRPTTLETPKSSKSESGSLFVSPSAFPKWEE